MDESKPEVIVRRVVEHNATTYTKAVKDSPCLARTVTVFKHTDTGFLFYAEGISTLAGDTLPVEGYSETNIKLRIKMLLGLVGEIDAQLWLTALTNMESGGKAVFKTDSNNKCILAK